MYPYRITILCVALAAGILAGPCFAEVPWSLAALLGITIGSVAASLKGRESGAWLALPVLLILVGIALAPAPRALAVHEGFALSGVSVEGVVAPRPCGAPGENRVICELREDVPDGPRAGQSVYLDLEPSSDQPEWGAKISARGDLFVFSDGGEVVATLRCTDLRTFARPSSPLRRASNLLRHSVMRLCQNALSPNSGALLAGIILGDYRCLSPEDAASLKRSGLIHLCSASGLHVGILLLICMWLARRLRLSRSTALLFQMPLLLIYAMAAGMTPPIVRSGLLAVAAAAAVWRAREFNIIAAMSALALFSLLLAPELIASVSWQLTYVAAAGCVLLTAPLTRVLRVEKNKTGRLLATSLGAQSSIAPLLLHHFGEFSLLSPLSNLAVIPLIPAVMALGLGGALISRLPASWLRCAMMPLEILLRAVLAASRLAASQTWAVIFNPGIATIFLWVWYPLLWVALLLHPGRSSRSLTQGACALLLLASIVLMPGSALKAAPAGTQIIFLDVGQGDSVLLRGSDGTTVLVDGGPDEQILTAKLRSFGIRSLDLVVLTHPHSDHVGGLAELARLWPISAFVHNGDVVNGSLAPLLDALAVQRTPVQTLSAGAVIRTGSLSLTVLAPRVLQTEEGNENSLVLRAEMGGLSLLLAGDIGPLREQELVESGVSLRSDLLKVPHHGGSSPAAGGFFAAVKPACAFIQVGADNSFGHPALSILQILRRLGCRVFRTDEDGDIVVSNPDGHVAITTRRRP